MRAAIHPFPGRDPNLVLGEPADDLLAELAAAVGSPTPGRAVPGHGTPGRGSDHRASVHPIAHARRGGANDLVAASTGLHLRRHHLALVVVTVALALGMALLTGLVAASADGDVPVTGTRTLEGGETLWGLATELTPADGDVRQTVALLLDVNDFESPTLPVGTVVKVPSIDG